MNVSAFLWMSIQYINTYVVGDILLDICMSIYNPGESFHPLNL